MTHLEKLFEMKANLEYNPKGSYWSVSWNDERFGGEWDYHSYPFTGKYQRYDSFESAVDAAWSDYQKTASQRAKHEAEQKELNAYCGVC